MAPPARRIGRLIAHGVIGDQRRYRFRPARASGMTVRNAPPDLRLSRSYLAARLQSRPV